MSALQKSYGYVAYCDESGDPGLKPTASKWFIPSAMVVRSELEADVVTWRDEIKAPMKNKKREDIHFNKLSPGLRERACRVLASHPAHCFSVLSWKASMLDYRNFRVEAKLARREYRADGLYYTINPKNDYLHNWMLKVLLERVTAFCAHDSIARFNETRLVKFVIATRDGFYLDDFIDYLKRDRENELNGTAVLPYHLDARVVDWDLFSEAPAASVPGLQMADIVCGAFSHAVDKHRLGKCNPTYAHILEPVMAVDPRLGVSGERYRNHFGVTAWPYPIAKARLPQDQTDILSHYGYSDKWLGRPGPTFSAR